MAKLTNKQRAFIQRTIGNLKRAHDYIQAPDIAVCHKGTIASTTLHYSRAMDNSTMYSVDKQIGSNLTGLEQGLNDLLTFLTQN